MMSYGAEMHRAWVERLILFLVVLVLMCVGVVMIYSTSAIYAQQKFHDDNYFLHRQLIWCLIGLIGFLVTLRLDYHRLAGWSRWILPASFILLIAVFVPPFGRAAGGAQRWVQVGVVGFQASEFAKLALVIYMADFFSRRQDVVRQFWKGFVPPMLIVLSFLGLILLQPDLGTVIALGLIALILFYVGRVRLAYLWVTMLASLPVLCLFIFNTPYRRRRILAFLNPWDDPQGIGFQIIQSFIALGSGGVNGVGLGGSRQKLFYLPEAHTDFIFSILGEELGLAGTLGVCFLFVVFLVLGIRIAMKAQDLFGCLMATGIVSMIGLHAIINIGVVTGSLPTKGLPLPFISFGGSSLLINLLCLGVVFNIAKQSSAINTLMRVKGKQDYKMFMEKGR
jgi:cell division protein FtsW